MAVLRWQPNLEVPTADPDSDEKPPLALHHAIISQVLKRCVHHVGSGSPKVRLIVMDVAALAAKGLSDRSDELLPLLHKFWKPLVCPSVLPCAYSR